MEVKYLKCSHCGNIIAIVKDSGVKISCCGYTMEELVPGSVDASLEKHVPVYKKEGNVIEIKVGEVAHPMTEEHYIEWISIKTKNNNYYHCKLNWNDLPEALFTLNENDEVEFVYAYCNLHGLWYSKVN